MFSKNYKEYVLRVKEVVEHSLLDDDGDVTMQWDHVCYYIFMLIW
jgi:hypothetical protein